MRIVEAATEAKERAEVCRIAREYERTPYHDCGRKKGLHGGVDCLTFIVGVYEDSELIPKQQLPPYSTKWHLHNGVSIPLGSGPERIAELKEQIKKHLFQQEEKYLKAITSFCRKVDSPQSGDLVIYRLGTCFSHGAVVLSWPTIIHAYYGRNVFVTDATNDADLRGRIHEFYSFWEAR